MEEESIPVFLLQSPKPLHAGCPGQLLASNMSDTRGGAEIIEQRRDSG